jgi:4-amino-4-deoxy-L-arabinose transferase-like glycosyltransferase
VTIVFILLLSAILRTVDLTGVPNGFHADEASIGYDAFSMLETGRDQYGEFLPLFSRSFGDYDESLYRFLTIPFVGLLGLTEFATRLPAALAGILTIWVFFCLVREGFDTRLALLAALLLAISPWHIQSSRWAVRANLLPLFLCWGLLYFQRGLQRPRLLVVSALLFGITLHTYNSARAFVPLFLLGLVLLHWRELWTLRKYLVVLCIVFLCILVPLSSFWISPEGLTRAKSTITTDVVEIVKNYISYVSLWYLFYSGDPNLRHSILGMGQLHTFEVFTVIAGLIGMARSRKRAHRVWWLWLLLYPIPAALTEPMHAIRSILGAPLFALFSGYGLVEIGGYCRSGGMKRVYRAGTVAVVVASVIV